MQENLNNIRKLSLNSGRVFVIGDLHGCYDLLMTLMKEVGFNEKEDSIVSCGDLVDRGSNSPACIELINKNWFYSVRGNHEDYLFYDYAEYRKTGFHYAIENMGNKWSKDYFDFLIKKDDESIIKSVSSLPYVIDLNAFGSRYFVVHGSMATKEDSKIRFLSDKEVDLKQSVDGDIVSNVSLSIDLMNNPGRKGAIPFLIDEIPFLEGLSPVFCGHTVIRDLPLLSRSHLSLDTGAILSYRDDRMCLSAIEINKQGRALHQVNPTWGHYYFDLNNFI